MASLRSGSGKASKKDEMEIIVPTTGWRVQETLRAKLKTPPGPIISEEKLPKAVKNYEKIVTVGDHCTLALRKKGIIPNISIVDFKTRRSEKERYEEEIKKVEAKVLRVRNEPGWLSRELWDTIADAYKEKENVRIEVDGEEDLASLACVALAPQNKKTLVVFGIPDRGMVLVDVCERTRNEVASFLNRMERR